MRKDFFILIACFAYYTVGIMVGKGLDLAIWIPSMIVAGVLFYISMRLEN